MKPIPALFNTIKILFFGGCILSSVSFAQTCPKDRSDYFCIAPEDAPASLIREADFYDIPHKIIGMFEKELQFTSSPLVLDARWDSPYFGAGMSLYNNQMNLMILGGMARMEGMTLDAYAAVVCHEIGHLLGGAPHQDTEGSEWASVEGQSDFFSASVCLPKYFRSLKVSEKNIPARIEEAGYQFFKTIKPVSTETSGQPLHRGKVKMPVVEKTTTGYPSLQCRYENFRNPKLRPSCWFRE